MHEEPLNSGGKRVMKRLKPMNWKIEYPNTVDRTVKTLEDM